MHACIRVRTVWYLTHTRSQLRSPSPCHLTHMTNHMWTATGGRGGHCLVSHINWAHPVCVDLHSSYELRFSLCAFRYIHITSMHPCRNTSLNKILLPLINEGFMALFQHPCCCFFFYLHNHYTTGVSAHSHTPSFFHLAPLLIATVPQRALWRVPLYSPAHHHA